MPDVNDEDKEQEEEINKKSQSLGLEISQPASPIGIAFAATTKTKLSSKRNYEPARVHSRKADKSQGEHRASLISK